MEEDGASSLCDRVSAHHREACVFSLGAPGESGKCKELTLYSLWVLEKSGIILLEEKKLGCWKAASVGQHLTLCTWGEQERLCGHLLHRQGAPRAAGLGPEPGAGAQGMVWPGRLNM